MTDTNRTILACVDGSLYTDSVCDHAAWASQRLGAPIQLLHLQTPTSDYAASAADLSGALGLGAKSSLLEKLTQVDEARGKLEQQKGNLILAHAQERLSEAELGVGLGVGLGAVDALHRRGSLVETIAELEASTQLVVLGKRGEHADFATLHLGSNLERVARAAQRPVLVASRAFQAIKRFVIALRRWAQYAKGVELRAQQPPAAGAGVSPAPRRPR